MIGAASGAFKERECESPALPGRAPRHAFGWAFGPYRKFVSLALDPWSTPGPGLRGPACLPDPGCRGSPGCVRRPWMHRGRRRPDGSVRASGRVRQASGGSDPCRPHRHATSRWHLQRARRAHGSRQPATVRRGGQPFTQKSEDGRQLSRAVFGRGQERGAPVPPLLLRDAGAVPSPAPSHGTWGPAEPLLGAAAQTGDRRQPPGPRVRAGQMHLVRDLRASGPKRAIRGRTGRPRTGIRPSHRTSHRLQPQGRFGRDGTAVRRSVPDLRAESPHLAEGGTEP